MFKTQRLFTRRSFNETDLHIGAEQAPITNADGVAVQEDAVEVHIDIPAEMDVESLRGRRSVCSPRLGLVKSRMPNMR